MAEADIYDEQVMKKSVQYLFNSRQDGMWSARWGINYVYAVGAVFPGLARVGYDMKQEWIVNVTKRLISVQQQDGGFGEDQDSYNRKKYVKGVTTASMTAWGLMSYLQVAHTMDIDENIERAARYLIRNFRQNGNKFFDRSVVGTGHRGLLNLQYPVYAYTFPLMALSRLRTYLLNKKNAKVNPYLNEDLIAATMSIIKSEITDL